MRYQIVNALDYLFRWTGYLQGASRNCNNAILP
jgi:hypothetical protein